MADDLPPDGTTDDYLATDDERKRSQDHVSDTSINADDASVPPSQDAGSSEGPAENEMDQPFDAAHIEFDVPDIVVGQYIPDHPLLAPTRHRRIRAGAAIGLTAAAGVVWIGAVSTFSPAARHEIGQVARPVRGGDNLAPAAAPEPVATSSTSTAQSSSTASSGGSPSIAGLNIAAALQPAIDQAEATNSSTFRT